MGGAFSLDMVSVILSFPIHITINFTVTTGRVTQETDAL